MAVTYTGLDMSSCTPGSPSGWERFFSRSGGQVDGFGRSPNIHYLCHAAKSLLGISSCPRFGAGYESRDRAWRRRPPLSPEANKSSPERPHSAGRLEPSPCPHVGAEGPITIGSRDENWGIWGRQEWNVLMPPRLEFSRAVPRSNISATHAFNVPFPTPRFFSTRTRDHQPAGTRNQFAQYTLEENPRRKTIRKTTSSIYCA